jgi:hypothetical protein
MNRVLTHNNNVVKSGNPTDLTTHGAADERAAQRGVHVVVVGVRGEELVEREGGLVQGGDAAK